MIEGYLTTADIAERLGIAAQTVRVYKTRGTLPPPDAHAGQSPLWREETINAWEAARPGQDWRKGRTDRPGPE